MSAAAIELVETLNSFTGKMQGQAVKVTQNDWVVVDAPGIHDFIARLITGAVETPTFPTLTINNTGDAYDTDDTTIAYDGATALTRKASGYYVRTASGEILYVEVDSGYDSTSGNLTVRRGALGTDASATGLADGNTLYVLCAVVLGSATTGVITLDYTALPMDPSAEPYPVS